MEPVVLRPKLRSMEGFTESETVISVSRKCVSAAREPSASSAELICKSILEYGGKLEQNAS